MKKIVYIILYFMIVINLSAQVPAYWSENSEYFQMTQLYPPGSGGSSKPFVVDWNKDGKKDLVVGGYRYKVWLYINEGSDENPVFSTAQNIQVNGVDLYLGSLYSIPAVFDVNGDGKDDLIVVERFNKIAHIYLNVAASSSDPIELGSEATNISGISTGLYGVNFWNRTSSSGKPVYDLLKVDSGKYNITVEILSNLSTTTKVMFSTNGVTLQFSYDNGSSYQNYITRKKSASEAYVYPCNWDGDNNLDLIVAHSYRSSLKGNLYNIGNTFEWYEQTGGTGSSNFVYKGEIKANGETINIGWEPTVCVVDWNNDNYMDILSGDKNGCVHLFLGTSNKTNMEIPSPSVLQANPINVFTFFNGRCDAVDWNNDGKNDLLTSGGHCIYLFLNEGSNEEPLFREQRLVKFDNGLAPFAYYYSYEPINFILNDLDNNGSKDLLIYIAGYYKYDTPSYLLFFTNRTENPDNEIIFSGGYNILMENVPYTYGSKDAGITILDWDNDGKEDDMLFGSGGENIYIYTNSASSSVLPAWIFCDYIKKRDGTDLEVGSSSLRPNYVDFDKDGAKDLLVAGDSKIYYFKNYGTTAEPIFDEAEFVHIDKNDIIKVGGTASIIVMDWDNNGWYDIINANTSGEYQIFWGAQPRFVDENSTENLPESEIYCYPNPATGPSLNIRYVVRDDSNINIKIYTITGKLIKEIKTFARFDKEGLYELDTTTFANGSYIVKITATSTVDGTEESRIVKLVITK